MPLKKESDAYCTLTFIGQGLLSIAINFGINFGIGWASFGNWGQQKDTSQWPEIYVWKWNSKLNSNIAMDFALTTFLTGFMLSLFTTGAIDKV